MSLWPKGMLKKFCRTEADLIPNNMAITDFSGRTSKSEGILALDIFIGSVTKTTVFLVIPSKANYNLLLGREWIHGLGAVPSTLHQKMFLWNMHGDLEVVPADGSPSKFLRLPS